MAEHIGFDVETKVNTDGFKKAYSDINKFESHLKTIDEDFKKLGVPDSLYSGMDKANGITGKLGKSAQQTAKDLSKVNGSGFDKVAKSAGKGAEKAKQVGQEIDKALDKDVKTNVVLNDSSAKQKTKELADGYKKVPKETRTNAELKDHASGPLQRLKDHFSQTNSEAKKTNHTIRDFALSGAIANGISSIGSSMYSGFKSAVKEGIELNSGLTQINASFKNMNMSKRQVKGLDNQIGLLKKTVGLTGIDASNLQKQMLNWSTIGTGGAKKLTTAVAEIGAASRMPADKIGQLGASLMRVGASGKVTLSSLSRLTRNASGFYAVLAKGAGMSQTQLKATLATGDVTQKQFQTWMANSSKYAGGVFKDYSKTVAGATNRIKSGWQGLEAEMTKPLMNVRATGMQQLASLMQSKPVLQGAHLLGIGIRNAAEWGMRGLAYLSKHRKDVIGVASDAVKIAGILAKDIWRDFSEIIFNIAKDFGLVNKNAKPGSGLHSFRVALDGLAKNKSAINTIAHALVLMAGLKGLTTVAKGVSAISGAIYGKPGGKGLSVASVMNSKRGLALRGQGKGMGFLNGSLQSLRSASNGKGLVAGFKNLSTAGKVATGVAGAGVAIDAGSSLFQAFKDRHSATKRSQDIGQGIGAGIGGGIGLYFGGPAGAAIGASIGKVVGKWGGSAVNKFTKGWQSGKKPKSFWSIENLGYSAHNMSKSFGKNWNSLWGKAGNSVKKASRSIGKNWHHGVSGVNKWFSNLPKDTQKAGNGVKSWASKTGNNIHKAWNKGIKSSHDFFKNLPKNWHNFQRSFGRNWNNFWGSIPKNFHNFQKTFGKDWRGFWHGLGKFFSSTWNAVKTNWHNFWTYLPRNWHNFQRSFGKGWRSFWSGIGQAFKNVFKTVKTAWDNSVGAIIKAWDKVKGFFGGLQKFAGKVGVKSFNNMQAFSNDLSFATGHSRHKFKYIKAHAKGTASLVGEAGVELAYKPYANKARLLGARGPEVTHIQNGEKILNAKDTAKVLHGGLGRGLVLNGYANGTAKLGQTEKTVKGDYKQIVSDSKQSLDKLTKNNKSSWGKVKNDSSKSVNSVQKHNKSVWSRISNDAFRSVNGLRKKNNSTWQSIASQTNKQTNKTRKSSISDYTNMRKGVNKQMDALHDGVISTANSTTKGFGKALGKMDNYARSAMKETIAQLNKGIGGIDKVISEFGGSSSAIKPVHFATGSNGELTSNTLAMVNDAKNGPRQESIVRGGNLIVPHGKDRIFALQKGDRVLNGRQTLGMAYSMGMPHFAKGSGVGHGQLKHLYDIAKQNWKQPDKTAKPMFGQISGLRAGAKVLADNALKTGRQEGLKFWSTMWSMAKSKVNDDGGDLGPATGLLKEVEHLGRGHKYVLGTWGPDTYDCSGLVSRAIQDMFHKGWGRMNVAGLWTHAERISKSEAKPGDPVFWLPNHHVGIYIGGDKYWSAFSPNAHPDIGVHPISSSVPGVHPTYGRFKGISNHAGSSKQKVKVKTNSAYEKFVKNTVGNGFWAMMKKIGNAFSDAGGSMANPAGDSVKRWRPAVIKALRANHFSATRSQIDAWMRVIQRESNGNPHAINNWDSNAKAGTPSKGLVQTIDPTFRAYAFKGHHNIYNGYDDLLAGINYMAHKYGRGSSAFARVSGPEGYAKGGDVSAGKRVIVGEHGPEVAEFKQPAHIYDHGKSKTMFDKLTDRVGVKKVQPTSKPSLKPVINININGNISSEKDANRVADIVDTKLEKLLEEFADRHGLDPSYY